MSCSFWAASARAVWVASSSSRLKASAVTVSTSPRVWSMPAAALTASWTLWRRAGFGLVGSSSSMTDTLRRVTAPGARTTFWTDLFNWYVVELSVFVVPPAPVVPP